MAPSPRSLRLRRYRVRFALGIVCILFGALILTVREDLYRFGFPISGVFTAAFAFFIYGTAILLLMYLRGAINLSFLDSIFRLVEDSSDQPSSSRDTDQQLDTIWAELQRLNHHVASRGDVVLSQGERDELLTNARKELSGVLVAELEQKYSAEYRRTEHLNQARQAFRSNAQRLHQEIGALSRRGNLNLVIGVLTTLLAASLLVYTSVQATHSFTELPDLLSYYIPRITTVIFIEVFAFFFLRLYRASLTELQYYQDELTRLAIYEVALEAAMRIADSRILGALLGRMILPTGRSVTPVAVEPEVPSDELDTKLTKQLIELLKTAKDAQ